MEEQYDPNYTGDKIFFRVGQKAIIRNEDKKILILKRSVETGGYWSFAGGGLEKNELLLDSIKREIKEETNLDCIDFHVFHVHNYISNSGEPTVSIVYYCNTLSGDIKLNWEHDEYKWIFPKEALQMDLTVDAKIIINQYLQ